MSTPPDPESFSLLAKMVTAGAAVFGPVGGLWLWIDARFAKKHTVNNQIQSVTAELGVHRTHIATIFGKLEEAAALNSARAAAQDARSEERHRELLMHLLQGPKS